MKKLIAASLLILSAAMVPVHASPDQNDTRSDLKETIINLDRELFDSFNKCAEPAQLEKHSSFFAPDVEFYHDNGGVTWTRDAMLANTKKYACGNYTRQLVPGTFHVYPIRDYGAISTGTHQFCQISSGSCAGAAEFLMIWHNADGEWLVTRSVSYGHRPTSEAGRLDHRDVLELLTEQNVPSVSVAFLKDGMLYYAAAYGESREGVPATTATLYNIASLSKPISAEVVMQLVARNVISLDEQMSKYWVDPDIAQDPRHRLLTPRLALSHRTGFPNWRADRLVFENDPGTVFGYSGEGFEYLARFIEAKTNKPLDYWAEQLVFTPLGMRQTSYTGQPWFKGWIAYPHDSAGNELTPQISNEPIASDNIFSTPSDYARFIASLMENRGLTTSLANERVRIQTDRRAEICRNLPESKCPSEAGIGLGWESYEINGHRYLMHSGSDEGTFTFSYYSPDTKSAAVIFTNSSNGSETVLPILRMSEQDREFVEFLDALVNSTGA